jgi:hypothetical protein
MDLVETREGEVVVRLRRRDLDLLGSALREASEALEDWEFETRMGCTRLEANHLATQLRELEPGSRE